MALRFDPIEEARRQWAEHGWQGLEAMSAAATISRAHQVVLAQIDRAVKPFRLTFSRYEALVLLAFTRNGSLPLGKMAERLMVHSTSVTNTIDRLERDGYVRRVAHPRDRRLILAEITEDGRAIVKQATEVLAEIEFGIPALSPQVLERLGDASRYVSTADE
ncbi:MAG TPA: MarR family transcriptional regulator [Acidimicrobiales bacterium]|nr:MarR family transcriptional regulator [Acidimicrobiales bacterium]